MKDDSGGVRSTIILRAEIDALRYVRVLFAYPKQPRKARLTVVGQRVLKQVCLAVTKLLIQGVWYP